MPHFRTWDSTYYDFQSGCDVVLLHGTRSMPAEQLSLNYEQITYRG